MNNGFDWLWIIKGCLCGTVALGVFGFYHWCLVMNFRERLSRFRLGQEIQNRFRQIENRREIVKY